MSNQSAAEAFDAAFDALGHPMRRRMLELLRDGARPVNQIASELPIGRPAVSKHLKVLEGAGLVEHRSHGTRNLYAVAPAGLAPLQRWLTETWDDTLGAFAAYVEQHREEPRSQRGEAMTLSTDSTPQSDAPAGRPTAAGPAASARGDGQREPGDGVRALHRAHRPVVAARPPLRLRRRRDGRLRGRRDRRTARRPVVGLGRGDGVGSAALAVPSWHPGRDGSRSTDITITFEGLDDGTLVRLVHSGGSAPEAPAAAAAPSTAGVGPVVLASPPRSPRASAATDRSKRAADVGHDGAAADGAPCEVGTWTPGPQALPRRRQSVFAHPSFAEHLAFLERLRERGLLVAAGPISEERGEGMAMVRALPEHDDVDVGQLARTDDASWRVGSSRSTSGPGRSGCVG